jgi:glucose/arabinose dehydrogenase
VTALVVLAWGYMIRADVPPSDQTPWLAMDRGPYFSASVESSLPERGMTPKGILIRVNKDKPAYVLFDADLLRYSCGWTGGSINFHNVMFDGSHQVWSKVVGNEVFGNGMIPGWAKGGSFEDPREKFTSTDYLPQPVSWQHRGYGPLPHDWARYRGLYVHGERIVLSYTVGGVGVLDSPGWEASGEGGVFTRTLNIEPSEKELVLQVAEHPLGGGGIHDGPRVLSSGGAADMTIAMIGEFRRADLKSARTTQPVEKPVCSWALGARDAARRATVQRYAVELHGGTPVSQGRGDWVESLALKRGDFGIVTDSSGIDLSADFTWSAWIKTAGDGTIFSKSSDGKWVSGGKAFFIRNGLLTFDVGWVGAVSASHPVTDDRWHHVAVTYQRDGGTARLYVDGDADGQTSLRPIADPADSKVRFGIGVENFPTGAANKFVGQIGPIQLYSKALSAVEVGALAGPVKKGISPLAVYAVGATNAMTWELTPQSQLRLHIPPGTAPVKIKLVMTQIDRPEEWVTFGKAAQSSKPAEDLSGLTHGGEPKWTQEIETHGVLSSAAKPYVIDTLPMPVENPWNSRMRLGGFDFFKGGHRAAVCTWDGDVWTVDGIDEKLDHLKWRRIAAGMFQPLGLKIVPDAQGNEQIYLCCRDQITRLHDLNGDGEIDFYESFNNDHQVTEHFHEFAMDLQTDAAGNFYYTKGGRHALPAVVPQHGTILKVSPDGKTTEIVCTGFRAPNGLGLGPDGQMVTSDQEGHWTPANRIDWVKPGGFYGYMWSFDGTARKASAGFDPPLCWMPVKLDRSPAEELWVSSDKWGPLKGKMIHTSYGTGKMFLVMYETINGVPQGGVVPFADIDFNTGTMRGRFNPEDGQLYVCGLVGWASNLTVPGGFFRVRYTGRKLYSPVDLHVTQDAVAMTFSEPLNKSSAQDLQNYAVQQWQYRWTEKYGSAHYRVSDPSKEGQDEVTVAGATVLADGKTVVLKIPGLKPVMQMQIEMNVDAADGTPIHTVVHNTINAIGR